MRPDMLNPWDGNGQRIELVQDTTHEIVGIQVYTPDDPDDDRFSIGFRTADGRTLKVRLPGDQLTELGNVLLRLAEARRCLK
jgi:hypothetical protein